jgi:uncharacterized membrane protein
MSGGLPSPSLRATARRARRTTRRESWRDYANGALWVLPTVAAVLAVVAGSLISHIDVPPGRLLSRLAFQGTADDARTLLIAVTSTVVTVIALVLGLTVVALQMSSTQFSPRLLRNFLRDRATQVVLSVFVATFAYSAAGLFTVGVDSGTRSESFPRLAVSMSVVLLFASIGMVIYFADHLVHSIQLDAINRRIEQHTLRVIARRNPHPGEESAPRAPPWAVSLTGRRSGYVQVVHPEILLPLATDAGVTICLRPRVGQHVVAGTTIGWVWSPTAEDPRPAAGAFVDAIEAAVRIGFERTLKQDVAFGIRQQIDIALKALSPAVNDPYTAVQVIHRLTTVCCDLVVRPLGSEILADPSGRGRAIVPGNTFADYLSFICNRLARYGGADITVMTALLRLLRSCVEVAGRDADRLVTLDRAATNLLADAERTLLSPDDLASFRDAVEHLRTKINRTAA